jgi:hypothetical protein
MAECVHRAAWSNSPPPTHLRGGSRAGGGVGAGDGLPADTVLAAPAAVAREHALSVQRRRSASASSSRRDLLGASWATASGGRLDMSLRGSTHSSSWAGGMRGRYFHGCSETLIGPAVLSGRWLSGPSSPDAEDGSGGTWDPRRALSGMRTVPRVWRASPHAAPTGDWGARQLRSSAAAPSSAALQRRRRRRPRQRRDPQPSPSPSAAAAAVGGCAVTAAFRQPALGPDQPGPPHPHEATVSPSPLLPSSPPPPPPPPLSPPPSLPTALLLVAGVGGGGGGGVGGGGGGGGGGGVQPRGHQPGEHGRARARGRGRARGRAGAAAASSRLRPHTAGAGATAAQGRVAHRACWTAAGGQQQQQRQQRQPGAGLGVLVGGGRSEMEGQRSPTKGVRYGVRRGHRTAAARPQSADQQTALSVQALGFAHGSLAMGPWDGQW